jgi:hypothetical protein
MTYSLKVYLTVEHIDGEDFDHWTFNSMEAATKWLQDYPVYTHNWVLSSQPTVMPESEYTEWKEVGA